MAEFEISNVTFADEGIAIQYIELPTDVRVEGRLVKTHVLQLDARHRSYREDIETLHDRVLRVLRSALEDFDESEPFEPPRSTTTDEEDDDRGMGE